MTGKEFQELTESGIVLLDGATGSNLRKAGMPVGVCAEQWVIDHPEVILALQKGYADAGSRIVYAPTFMANRVGLSLHGLEDRLEEMNSELVALSRKAVGDSVLVAGDLTTCGKSLEELPYEQLIEVYREQIEALCNAGVDLLVAETMLNVEETMAAVEAAQSVCELPVMCSLTLQADGSLIYGGTAAEMAASLEAVGAAAVGLNCSVGPDQLESVVTSIRGATTLPVIAKPNAGLPTIDDKGEAHYSMGPEAFVKAMEKLIDCGADIVGGCCGTDPSYIRLLGEKVRSLR